MSKPIEEIYFDWLCREVLGGRLGRPRLPYVNVCAYMHTMMFKDDVPNDDNRTAEGCSLREEFMASETGRNRIHTVRWRHLATDPRATLLEVLVGMARRCDFQVDLGVQDWFFKFIENLHLEKFRDEDFQTKDRLALSKKLNPFNNRTYSPSGAGSIFPLKHPHTDMRKLELWYQMSAYIMENRMIR